MPTDPQLTTIYIVRHGQSEGNVDQVAGGPDPELTALGKSQIGQVNKQLKDVQFDAIFCSDLRRAVQSAEIMNSERQLAIATYQTIRERSFGSFYKGKTTQEIRQLLDQLHIKFSSMSDEELWTHKVVPDMESYEEALTRFITFLREVGVGYPGKTVLIISHGNLMRSFLIKLGYGNFSQLRSHTLTNGALIKVKSDGVDFFLEEVKGLKKL